MIKETHARITSAKEFARVLVGVSFCVLTLSTTGCAFNRGGAQSLPMAFSAPPTLPQLVDTLNSNSQRVQQLHSNNVRLSIPGPSIGSLTATLDFERSPTPEQSPGRFRLSGQAFGTRQLDLGSNDREYWMWVKQNKPPTVFWGTHSQFYQSAAQQILPVPPSFIVDAMGIVSIEPATITHDQLYRSSSEIPGLVEIRSRIPTPRGDLTRVFQVDQERAVIVQQAIYDSTMRVLAVADARNFVHDAFSGVALPRSIQIKLPPAGLAFDFEVDDYTINQPVNDPMTLWSMPELRGHQYLDLANPNDMRGVNLTGNANQDFYDSRATVSKPVRAETPRAARRLLPAFNVFR